MTRPEVRVVWRKASAAVERDVLAFWRRAGLLAPGVDLAQRLAELCLVAYDGEKVVAVLTAELRNVEFVRSRLAVIRLAAPGDRTTGLRPLPMRMIIMCRQVLEDWSRANPQEKVMGIAMVVQFTSRSRIFSQAVWPLVDFTLVSYTPRGQQFRISWFKHARVE